MTVEVARLDAVLPIVEELQLTDFEDSPYCRNLGYARGAFGDLGQDGCERQGTVQFDAVATEDHARLAEAIVAAEVAATRIPTATYDADGKLLTAWFVLQDDSVSEDWAYLYDPTRVESTEDVPGRQDFTRIVDDWWFVRSYDD
jgi:hypothetical protein